MQKQVYRRDCQLDVWFETVDNWQVLWIEATKGVVDWSNSLVLPRILTIDEQLNLRDNLAQVDFWKLPNVIESIDLNGGLQHWITPQRLYSVSLPMRRVKRPR